VGNLTPEMDSSMPFNQLIAHSYNQSIKQASKQAINHRAE